ncbi:HAD family hydrolase [Lachnospiraceae bacterium LCP25S3_G4]
MIKLIASDLDGTILQNGAQSIEPGFLQLIMDLKAKGIHFVAASGREYDNMRRLFTGIEDEISYISVNGSQYHYHGRRHILSTISRELTHRIIKAIRAYQGCDIIYSTTNALYVEPKNEAFIHHLTEEVHNNVTLIDDLLQIEEPALKIALYNTNGVDAVEDYFTTCFQDEISVRTSGNLWLDFIPFGADKGVALKRLIGHMGIFPEECMAFGDQRNDLEMLEFAGVSYAMEHAAPGVADCSNYTTDSVSRIIKKLL